MMAGTSAEVSAPRAMWLLTRLRLNRLLNQVSSTYNRRIGGGKSRSATPDKKRNRWFAASFMMLMMAFSFISIAHQSIINLHCRLDESSLCYVENGARLSARASDVTTHELLSAPFSSDLMGGITMLFTLLFLSSFLMPLSAREMAQPDWDMEWLSTLPTSRTVLLMGRLLERTLANPSGLFAVWPACLMVAWYSGCRWSAPVLAVCGALPLLVLAALVRTLFDTGLRLLLPPSQLRNLQACISIVSIPVMYLAISFGTNVMVFAFDWARAFPHWAIWTPPGLAVQAINANEVLNGFMLWALLYMEIGLCTALGIIALNYQLRNGVVAASSRESGRRKSVSSEDRSSKRTFKVGSVVQRRELRLLSRDRNFLMQTLLLPVIIVVSQLIFNGRLSSFSDIGSSPAFMAALAFGISAYVLMVSAFQTLNTEGGALWLLYTFPHSIESVLKEKAQMWAVLALFYPVVVFALGIRISHTVSWELIGMMFVVLLGIPIYSLIAVSLGVFACDPLAQDAQTKIRISYTYGYMMLSGVYVYSIYSGEWWQKLVFIVLTGALALSLWQKARDELPFLLDPGTSPAARVSSADGMIAVVIFFLLQGIAALFLRDDDKHLSMSGIVIAFSIAGAITYSMFRYEYWRSKTLDVPTVIGADLRQTLGWGVGMGAIAAILGLLYITAVRRLNILHDIAPQTVSGTSVGWLIVLTVVAAPLFEEFIFRGLIFGGLRRSTPTFVAIVVSAAIFAIVHPPVSMLPVFGLGIGAAIAYDRTKTLLAPMLVHAIYNATVVGYQLMLQ